MACYANPDPIFQKAMRLISSITREQEGLVTTTFDHNYSDNMFVRFYIPSTYGMPQINFQVVLIEVTSDTQFRINLDTTTFDEFSVPASPLRCAQVVPVGEFLTLNAATINVRRR